jgi:hypothetical protein
MSKMGNAKAWKSAGMVEMLPCYLPLAVSDICWCPANYFTSLKIAEIFVMSRTCHTQIKVLKT